MENVFDNSFSLLAEWHSLKYCDICHEENKKPKRKSKAKGGGRRAKGGGQGKNTRV